MLGMEQMYKMALDPRIFPDSRLLAVMQGKDQSLPMAVAMAAKQQRDKLMQASAGQQAQQGAKQPTVKDQMLAKDLPPEHAGLAALPAENMQGMGSEQMMAAGGIVAFDDNKDQPVKSDMPGDDAPLTNEQMRQIASSGSLRSTPEQIKKKQEQNAAFFNSLGDYVPNVSGALQSAKDYMYSDPQSKLLSKAQAGTLTQADVAPPATTPTINSTPTAAELATLQKGGPQNPNAPVGAAPAGTPVVKAPGSPAGGPGIGNPPASNAANQAQAQVGIGEPAKRVDRFAGLGETQAAFDQKVANEKRAATGDFLMNMGLKMMTTVGPLGKAIGEGGLAGLPGLAASRKSINELEKNRNDYRLNMAKAQTAADEGDQELALKYKTLAEQSVYHSGLVAADMIKSNAYAAGVGSKSDIAKEKFEASVLKAASDIHDKNMASGTFGLKFAKMTQPERQQYFADIRNQAAALAGKDTSSQLGSGFSMDAIDAAIARKEKSKS